jgi:hypothetical protein
MFVRYNVIGGRETTIMESAVFKAAAALRETGDFDTAIAAMRSISPDADDFVGRFERASVSRVATARYLLKKIEEAKRRTQELTVEGTDRVHLEHIYPQNPAGTRWPSHARVINRLGNLTLLSRSLNTSIKNADFAVKKERGYTGSDILLTQELLPRESWDADAVDERQRELATWAFDVWHFPGETAPAPPEAPSSSEPADDTEVAADDLPEVPG